MSPVIEHELVWKVYVQSEEYARTGNLAAMLVGHRPYLVDRADGGLHRIGVLSEVKGAWEDDCRTRIRGLPVRTPVDDLHDELRTVAEATGGRMAAVRALHDLLRGGARHPQHRQITPSVVGRHEERVEDRDEADSMMIRAVERCRTSVRCRAYALSDSTSWSLVMNVAPLPATTLRIETGSRRFRVR
ncbi:MAG: YrhB family protein [Streptomyces sp.]|nr:YrhB family protein [Streptomyces sp.]